jgi:hypothetical protein
MMVSAMLRNSQGDDAGASWIRLLPIDAWHSIGGTRRPPCAKTICELMNAISPHAREAALMRWVTEGLNLKLQLDEKSRVSRRNVGQIQYPGKVPNW